MDASDFKNLKDLALFYILMLSPQRWRSDSKQQEFGPREGCSWLQGPNMWATMMFFSIFMIRGILTFTQFGLYRI